MEQRVWGKGLAVGCELREVASRRADGSRHMTVSALVSRCNSERHVLMVCDKTRDREKWVMFRHIITSAKMYFSPDPIPNVRIHPLLPGYLPIHPFAFINDGDEFQ